MAESYTSPASYKSVEEIRMRRELLLKDIRRDASRMEQQWHSLFQKPQGLTKGAMPSRRIGSFLSMGGTFLDGALLAWKLYRKFKFKKK